MSSGFSTALRTARAQAIVNAIDAGAGAEGTIEIYGGGSGRPTTGAAITDQTLIGTHLLTKPCATVLNGVLTFDVIFDVAAITSDETIAWARFKDTDGVFVTDMGCGITGSGEEIIYNIVETQFGATIKITSGSITEGNL